MKFTDAGLKALKPREKPCEVFEGTGIGFGLRVYPTGRKVFVFRYKFYGTPRRMTLGEYGALSLKDARHALYEARAKLAHGRDPGREKIEHAKEQRGAGTVRQLVGDYIEHYAKKRKKTWREDERVLNKDVIPRWGSKKAKDVSPKDVRALLHDVAKRAPTTANRTFEIIRRMFNWAEEEQEITISPCLKIKKPSPENVRTRVLSEDELKIFWYGIGSMSCTQAVKLGLRLLVITGQRAGEVASIEKDEINLNDRWWSIPGTKTKNGRAHRVPLNDHAMECVKELIKLSGDSPYLLPSREGHKHIRSGVFIRALARNREKLGLERFVVHDLRRSFATLMSQDRQCRPYIDKILNHVDSSVTGRHYDHYAYDEEKVEVMRAWDLRLSKILSAD